MHDAQHMEMNKSAALGQRPDKSLQRGGSLGEFSFLPAVFVSPESHVPALQ